MKTIKRSFIRLISLALTAGLLSGCSGSFSAITDDLKTAVQDKLKEVTSGASETAGQETATEDSAGNTDSVESAESAYAAADDSSREDEGGQAGGFYYDQSDDEVKAVYVQLYKGILDEKTEFSVSARTSDLIEAALSAVINDHPEFFYVTGNASILGTLGGTYQITLEFSTDPADIGAVRSEIEASAEEYLQLTAGQDDTYQKVRAAYEYIIKNTDYQLDSTDSQNIKSVFLHHASVCAGYAKAFQYLLHKAGVECVYVYGTISPDQTAHAFDLVNIDGTYTYCDPTWGDPAYGENADDSSKLDIIYDYLCMTTEEITRCRHVLTEDFTYPECTSSAYDFYVRLGDYLTSYDPDEISAHLMSTVNNGESVTYLKFSSDEAYQSALNGIFGDDGLIHDPLQVKMKKDNLTSISYYYSRSDELRTIKIFW